MDLGGCQYQADGVHRCWSKRLFSAAISVGLMVFGNVGLWLMGNADVGSMAPAHPRRSGVIVLLQYPWQINPLKRGCFSLSHTMYGRTLTHVYFVPFTVFVDVFLETRRGSAQSDKLLQRMFPRPVRSQLKLNSRMQAPKILGTLAID